MYSTLKNFPQQFKYDPIIKNTERLRPAKKFIVIGMGGSHLAADIVKEWNPYLEIIIHKDYGLPKVPNQTLKESLIILSSYSGETQEVLDAFDTALNKHSNLCAISTGGELIKKAQESGVPYIQMPNMGIQPRSALGFSTKAHVKLIGDDNDLEELTVLADSLDCQACESQGERLARKLKGKIPIIYSSSQNCAIAYNWKIKFNETGKIPAFYNVFPELSHNEINGFDYLSKNFFFLFLSDSNDDSRIQKRMRLTKKIYEDRDLPVEVIKMNGPNIWQKIFTSLLIADWSAYYTAKLNNVDPERVPIVEEFKKLIEESSSRDYLSYT